MLSVSCLCFPSIPYVLLPPGTTVVGPAILLGLCSYSCQCSLISYYTTSTYSLRPSTKICPLTFPVFPVTPGYWGMCTCWIQPWFLLCMEWCSSCSGSDFLHCSALIFLHPIPSTHFQIHLFPLFIKLNLLNIYKHNRRLRLEENNIAWELLPTRNSEQCIPIWGWEIA